MRQMLENYAAAAALAEEGLWEDAEELISSIRSFGDSSNTKVLVVTDSTNVSDTLLHSAAILAKRLVSDVLVLLEAKREGDEAVAKVRKQVEQCMSSHGLEAKVLCLAVKGDALLAAEKCSSFIRGLALAVAPENRSIRAKMKRMSPAFPVFYVK